MSEPINALNFVIIRFPVSHFISGWRYVRDSWHLIAFVKTEGPVFGVGEGTPYGSGILEDYLTAINLGNMLIGWSLEDAISVLREAEYKAFSLNNRVVYGAFLSIESALLDALSRHRKVSIARLLGNEYRNAIPVAGTVFLKHPYKMATEINSWILKEVNHIKIKVPCNLNGLERTLEIITRNTLINNNVILRVDANQCFKHFDKAVKALRIMEKHGVNIVEQPLPRDLLRDTARLRKLFHPVIKIMLDESLVRPHDIKTFAELEAADIINFHPSKLGCLSITRATALHAKRLGMEVQIGSSLMTEIGLTHYLNLVASLPALDYPLEEVSLYNTSYGYSIMCDPSVFSIEKGNIKMVPNVDIKNLCWEHIKPFSMSRLRFLEQVMFKQVARLAEYSNLLKRLLRGLV